MKKIGLFLGVLVALLTVSCSNILVSGKDGGSVSLVIDGATAQSIRSAGALRSTTGGSTYTLTASIRGDYTATQSVSSSTDGLGSVTFTFERVPVGKSIILDLTATANGSYIWYGNSGHHTVTRGENQLRIAVGRVSGVLLWNNSDVKIAPYGKHEEAGTEVLGVPDLPPSWCFDNTGNFYVIGSNGGSRYSLENGGIYDSAYTNFSGSNLRYVSYDNETSTLYGMSDSVISKIIENQGSSPVIDSLANDRVQTPIGFAVHNNIAYVACFSRTEERTDDGVSWKVAVTIFKYNLTDSSSGLLSSNEIILPPIFLSTTADGSAPTSQMIYQEGALYLLLGSLYIEDNKAGYSVGAVVKINAGNLAVESSFGQEGYLGLLTSSRTIHSKKCYAPTEANGNDYFYGPMGFVAIMPKKLVIADAGFAMSAASNGTNVSLSKKRRIVTVDLETEALSSVTVENYYEPSYSTGCGFEVIY